MSFPSNPFPASSNGAPAPLPLPESRPKRKNDENPLPLPGAPMSDPQPSRIIYKRTKLLTGAPSAAGNGNDDPVYAQDDTALRLERKHSGENDAFDNFVASEAKDGAALHVFSHAPMFNSGASQSAVPRRRFKAKHPPLIQPASTPSAPANFNSVLPAPTPQSGSSFAPSGAPSSFGAGFPSSFTTPSFSSSSFAFTGDARSPDTSFGEEEDESKERQPGALGRNVTILLTPPPPGTTRAIDPRTDPANAPRRLSRRTDSGVADIDDDEEEDASALSRTETMPANYGTGTRTESTTSAGFEFLLEQFAKMHTEGPSLQLEECPICTEMVKLDQFATHLYACLAVLDAADRKKQIEDDEKLALQLLAEEDAASPRFSQPRRSANDMDTDDSGRSRPPPPKRNIRLKEGDDVPECRYGAGCYNDSLEHFKSFIHPVSHPRALATPENHPECVVCFKRIPAPILEAHVNTCLENMEVVEGAKKSQTDVAASFSSRGLSTVSSKPSGGSTAFGTASTLPKTLASFVASSSSSSGPSAPKFGDMREGAKEFDEDEPEAGALGRAASFDDRDNDEADDEAEDGDDIEELPSAGAGAGGGKLTNQQLAACANFALKVKKQGGAAPFMKLLATFETMGLTEDNLRQRVAEATPSTGMSAFSAPSLAGSVGAGFGASSSSAPAPFPAFTSFLPANPSANSAFSMPTGFAPMPSSFTTPSSFTSPPSAFGSPASSASASSFTSAPSSSPLPLPPSAPKQL